MSISSLCKSGTPSGSDGAVFGGAVFGGSEPRLLFVATTKSQGGVETHSVAMAAALRRSGLFVQFACCPGGFVEAQCRAAGLPTAALRVRNSGDLGAALRLSRLIRAGQIDIVHVHSRRDYLVGIAGAALAGRLRKHRAGLVLHAHMLRPLGDGLGHRFFAAGADAAVAVSGAVYDRLHRDFLRNPEFLRLIPNGVELEQFARPGSVHAAEQRSAVRRSLTLAADALVVGMVGRLDAKGQRQLFAVLPQLAAQVPKLAVVLVGSEGKPEEQAALKAQAQAGGFGERIRFTGPRTDVPALLTAWDVLVHLPTDEAFGLALAEGMAAGLPTVATDIGGCRAVVQDGITGFLVPPGNSEALLAALNSLLDPAVGPMRRAQMGGAGRALVQSEFSQALQISRLRALYREICPVSHAITGKIK